MPSETGREETSALRALWAKRGFRNLLLGQTASGLGDWMATVALMTVVLDITGSSTAVGGVLVLRLAPTAIAGPLATRLSRDWDRKRTMLAMDAARIGVLLALPLIHTLWWVYTWAFLLEVAGLVFLPARDSSVATLADGEDLPLANGLVLGSSYGTIPLGAGAFAAVHALTGSSTIAFWIDAATFAVSFLMILSISMPDEPGDTDRAEESDGGFRARSASPSSGLSPPSPPWWRSGWVRCSPSGSSSSETCSTRPTPSSPSWSPCSVSVPASASPSCTWPGSNRPCRRSAGWC